MTKSLEEKTLLYFPGIQLYSGYPTVYYYKHKFSDNSIVDSEGTLLGPVATTWPVGYSLS